MGTFASIQQSKLTGKWKKAALIDCVNSILALPSSLPVCTIIDAVMNNLSMFNDIGLFNDKGALSDQFSFERRYPGRINVNAVSFILNEMDHM